MQPDQAGEPVGVRKLLEKPMVGAPQPDGIVLTGEGEAGMPTEEDRTQYMPVDEGVKRTHRMGMRVRIKAATSSNYPKTNLTVQMIAFPSLSDAGRFRFNSDFTASRDLLTSDFYVAATLFDDCDNRPPTEGARKNDFGVTFSLGGLEVRGPTQTMTRLGSVGNAVPSSIAGSAHDNLPAIAVLRADKSPFAARHDRPPPGNGSSTSEAIP
jgi:hypothetical protein